MTDPKTNNEGPNGGGTELIASSRRNWPSEKALQDGFNASLQRTGARRRINWEIDGNLWKEMSKFNVAMQVKNCSCSAKRHS